ncbi:unnamed protein product [Citrullus colocynthis]|uniref:Cytochrome P450 n=1 Tax=Citrullus colocynthis TaxID=252529 RepID=A0ABP0Y584_9ROSI
MDLLLLSISLISLFSLLLAFNFFQQPPHKNLPPTPSFSLPLIGHLHLLKHPVHQTLQSLSQKHGHVFSLRFGSRLVVVVSSSSLVQECFTKNDVILANRPLFKSSKYLTYNYTNLAIAPYGEHWRNLRRISTLEIFSASRLNLFREIREDEVKRLLCKLWDKNSFEEFKKYCGDDLEDEERSKKFKEMVTQVLAISAMGNPGDNTQPECYSDEIIKGLIQVVFLAGIDTIAVTLEWALSQLLNNSEVLKKARDEIDSSIGQDRFVNEADLSSLSYLEGIISETLRLNPAAPLLLPHCASEDCKIGGYDVPRDTMVLINAWAIHTDSSLWEDAKSFKPERHENAIGVDLYKLLPFGLGRRACPGMGTAQRVIALTLASLIQCFEWQRLSNSLVDMTEGQGLTMPKAQPLTAKCRPRSVMKKLLPMRQ